MNIKTFISNLIGKAKDNASDLKMAIGTAGVIGGTVLLCKETIAACDIVREYREAKKKLLDDGAEKSEIRKLKAKTVGKVALTVAPGAGAEIGGLTLMWNGYSNTKATLVGVTMAYGKLQDFTNKYRQHVRDEYGEEVDERFAYEFREEEVVVTDEDGTQRTETVKIYPNDYRKMPSIYARYFCYGEAEGAEKSFEYNDHFLHTQERLANVYLKAHKKMMLNELYAMLGIKDSEAGYKVGWIYDEKNPEGDNMIKLRIREVYREVLDPITGDVTGWERVHMIDPNVDGLVLDKMLKRGLIEK